MLSKLMTSFSAGLFVSAAVCGSVYFSSLNEGISEASQIEESSPPTETEMKALLTNAGYTIFSEEEWKKQLASFENVEPEITEPAIEKEETKEDIAYRTILNVTTGMTSIDVGKVLVQANITDQAMLFVNEVEKRGVANKLRPGTYEINSHMNFNDIISLIFKN